MERFQGPIFSENTIYADFEARRNALYRCHNNGILEENLM